MNEIETSIMSPSHPSLLQQIKHCHSHCFFLNTCQICVSLFNIYLLHRMSTYYYCPDHTDNARQIIRIYMDIRNWICSKLLHIKSCNCMITVPVFTFRVQIYTGAVLGSFLRTTAYFFSESNCLLLNNRRIG